LAKRRHENLLLTVVLQSLQNSPATAKSKTVDLRVKDFSFINKLIDFFIEMCGDFYFF
jgi:hypothetical protein